MPEIQTQCQNPDYFTCHHVAFFSYKISKVRHETRIFMSMFSCLPRDFGIDFMKDNMNGYQLWQITD